MTTDERIQLLRHTCDAMWFTLETYRKDQLAGIPRATFEMELAFVAYVRTTAQLQEAERELRDQRFAETHAGEREPVAA